MEGYEHGALRKELILAPLMESGLKQLLWEILTDRLIINTYGNFA